MAIKKITLAFVGLLTAGVFVACNGSHDKTGMDSQSGRPATSSSKSGNDTSHTTSRVNETVGGVNPQPEGKTKAANSGGTTAQGMTGADSVYQKGTQKSKP